MGLFDFLKKKKAETPTHSHEYSLPEMYKEYINVEEYNIIMTLCKEYFQEKNYEIKEIKEGEFLIDLDGGENRLYLDNIIRVLSQEEQANWKTTIAGHFDKLKTNEPAINYIFKDFEFAQQFLKLMIKPKQFFGSLPNAEELKEQYIHRIDYPETMTMLMIDFEEKFQYIRKEDVKEWELTEEELFDIALDNIAKEDIQIMSFQDKDTGVDIVYNIMNPDFAASASLLLQEKFDFTIGELGSVVMIPSKTSAFVIPINDGSFFDISNSLDELVLNNYNQSPGPINRFNYWYYQGNFQQFPIEKREDEYFMKLPDDLIKLLRDKE